MKHRILVVDDQPDIADALVRLLTTLGYEAQALYDGRQAAEQAAVFLPDLAFIDIRMPGFTGLEIVVGLLALRRNIPIILMTGYGDESSLAEAKRLGACGVLTKPFALYDLRTVVLNMIPDEAWLRCSGGFAKERARLARRQN